MEADDRMIRVASSHSCAAEVVGTNVAITAPTPRADELDTVAEGCPGMACEDGEHPKIRNNECDLSGVSQKARQQEIRTPAQPIGVQS